MFPTTGLKWINQAAKCSLIKKWWNRQRYTWLLWKVEVEDADQKQYIMAFCCCLPSKIAVMFCGWVLKIHWSPRRSTRTCCSHGVGFVYPGRQQNRLLRPTFFGGSRNSRKIFAMSQYIQHSCFHLPFCAFTVFRRRQNHLRQERTFFWKIKNLFFVCFNFAVSFYCF